MYCEMNMETGKCSRVQYEAGDLIQRRGFKDIFLIAKVERRLCNSLYHVMYERTLDMAVALHGQALRFVFRPCIRAVNFYK